MAQNKLVTVEQLDAAVDGFAAEVKAANFEKAANLGALAYEDEIGSLKVSSSLTTILAAKMSKTDAQNLVAGEVGMAYRPGGSYAFANLPAPSAANYGVVYHVTDDFTTDNRFAEGEGKNFSSGSEVGVVEKTVKILVLDEVDEFGTDQEHGSWYYDETGTIKLGEYTPSKHMSEFPSGLETISNGAPFAIAVFLGSDSGSEENLKNVVQDSWIKLSDEYYLYDIDINKTAESQIYSAFQDVTSGDTQGALYIYGKITNQKPVAGYIYNVFSGFIDTSKFASQSSFTTFKAALDNLEIATSTDIQNLIDGLSLEDPVVLAPGTYDENDNLLKSWAQLVSDGDVTVSSDGYGVLTTPDDIVTRFANTKKFVIDQGVMDTGGNAFAGCANLTTVTLPDGMIHIGSGAFAGCANLTTVTIPDSMRGIDHGAFVECTSLTEITIPDRVTQIESDVFNNCTNLATIHYSGTATGAPWGATNATVVA